VGDELPMGWEESYDPNIGPYYINHLAQSTQLEDPRQEWKSVQEQMLSDYLSAAQDQLENKREMFDVKQQRLLWAQEEYNHLKLAASRSSRKYLLGYHLYKVKVIAPQRNLTPRNHLMDLVLLIILFFSYYLTSLVRSCCLKLIFPK